MILNENQSINIVVRGLSFKDGHMLVTQWRTDQVAFGIGGRVDFGESVLDAIHREVREETGAEITINKLLYFCENIFSHTNGVEYHELGWYFWVELDRDVCGLDETIPNPDHPDLIIRYLKVDEESLRLFWPDALREYLPRDLAEGFSQNPRHLHHDGRATQSLSPREMEGLIHSME